MKDAARYRINARVRVWEVPPVRDGLVLGREAPIGCVALREALGLLVPQPFAHLELDDPVISDIIVREPLLALVPRAMLTRFVLEQIKPHMSAQQILLLDLEVEALLDAEVGGRPGEEADASR